ncbi:MAG: sodium ion-translocating decarboxylase subunit beta [Dehalococcoidia bacterium]|nr:MAG: sodium ion-translocating decarboxylase subunit beta [Dehalococcoidia bacterium]
MDTSNFWDIFEGFRDLGSNPLVLGMLVIGIVLIFLGIAKRMEPLLLVPIGTGIILANLPLGEAVNPATGEVTGGFLYYFYEYALFNGLIPLLIFLGLGALTDFEPLLAKPVTFLLGAAAQFGVFVALIGTLALGLTPWFDFGLKEAASVAIIGGAEGPTTIYVAAKMQQIGADPGIFAAVVVACYSYMALVPIIQPPVIKLLTTKKERLVKMPYAERPVPRRTKIIFPVVTIVLCGLFIPKAAPLIGMFMFGNLLRECGVVERLAGAAQNELMNIVTIMLGLTVGSTMIAKSFFTLDTIAVFALGIVAFITATAAGVLLGKLMYILSKGKVNPMIGAAGVSAVPMAARVVQNMATKEDSSNFLLMHAMGPNVAGAIGAAVAGGVLLSLVH